MILRYTLDTGNAGISYHSDAYAGPYYWGVKSIFWFQGRDGIFSLAGFLIWIAAIAVLAMILFNEGVSFSQTGKSVRISPGRRLIPFTYYQDERSLT